MSKADLFYLLVMIVSGAVLFVLTNVPAAIRLARKKKRDEDSHER